ncbi:hypothetical protein SKAU_G00411400 [Synaphobranchus kaupii]|uniref:Uncharacterized protein n=1 Tax=Synaphobranchus kaupii TaxID=118154 RepID=A0A9Q1E7T9_SYNKA|nr:hypothetical protein SKAU_G00411400 [Synaphobranchus kaupii]
MATHHLKLNRERQSSSSCRTRPPHYMTSPSPLTGPWWLPLALQGTWGWSWTTGWTSKSTSGRRLGPAGSSCTTSGGFDRT